MSKYQLYFLNRLSSKEIYNLLISPKEEIISMLSSIITILTGENAYLVVCIATQDSKLRAFQFKFLYNVLYLNKMLFKFGKIGSHPCSFCHLTDETPYYLLCECGHIEPTALFLLHSLNTPPLTSTHRVPVFI